MCNRTSEVFSFQILEEDRQVRRSRQLPVPLDDDLIVVNEELVCLSEAIGFLRLSEGGPGLLPQLLLRFVTLWSLATS